MDETHVVTAFLRLGSDILLTRRSDAVGTYQGRWAGISGYAEGDPDSQVWVEIREETGLSTDDCSLVRAGDPLDVRDGDHHWVVHPYLFDAQTRDITPNEELTETEWVPVTTILDRETVPGLWTAYDRVRPTVETIQRDTDHGSAYLSIRALDVLRDEAATADSAAAVASVARGLLDARPAMAALINRVNRAMWKAIEGNDRTAASTAPEVVHDAAIDVAENAVGADAQAASRAADHADGKRVATISRSGTVMDALFDGSPASVAISESRPGGEGVAVAEDLSQAGIEVTLTTDANLPNLVGGCDVVLVGADSIHPDGSLVNKVGTYALACGAGAHDVPLYCVCAADKIATEAATPSEQAASSTLYEPGDAAGSGAESIRIDNPLFDVTPPALVTGIVTEDGLLDTVDVANRAAEHRRIAQWSETP